MRPRHIESPLPQQNPCEHGNVSGSGSTVCPALRIITNVLRIVLALTFLASGFVKAIDPLGTVYKMGDYAEAFGMAGFAVPRLLLMAAMLLCLFEFIIGICILFGIWNRTVLTAALLFLSVMTPLTFYLALANPVSDCGCFGEAIILTNWQTFLKNIVLLAITVFVLINNQYIVRFIRRSWQWMIIAFALVSLYIFMSHNLRHLPVVDFRPWHIGANIEQSMSIPDDAPQPQYETLFTLTRDGEEREFTLADYPDSTWTFVRSRSVLLDPGYVPPIADFNLIDNEGNEITDVLFEPGWTFLLVMNHLRGEDVLDAINDLYDYASIWDCSFYALTSSTTEEVEQWRERTGARYDIFHMDDITLKTIVRSDPGLVLIHDGVITGKWSRHDLPQDDMLSSAPESQPWTMTTMHDVGRRHLRATVWMFFPYLFIALLCLIVPHSEDKAKTLGKKCRQRDATINNSE